MILGSTRNPFERPAAASASFQPRLPDTGFISLIHPFSRVTNPMWAATGYRPPLNPYMGPVPLPDVPMPTAPAVPVAAQTTKPGGVSGFGAYGFGAAGFGSTGGVRGMGHHHVDPYMQMRMGVFPGISPSGRNIRAGIRNAGARVQRSMPFQTAELPPLPPPPVVAPAPGPVAGLLGAFGLGRVGGWRGRQGHAGFRRPGRRGWFSRMIQPETVQEVQASPCETVYDSVSGMHKTICNGRVVQYQDAQGNVLRPGDYA